MKITKTYSIEESIYNAFDYLTIEKNINKSSFIEDLIKKFLKDNDFDFEDKYYYLKTNPNMVVSVISQDPTFYQLNDGSKMNKILFSNIFNIVKPIEPEEFLKPNENIYKKIIDKIKNVDTDYKSEYDRLIKEKREFENDKEKLKEINEKLIKLIEIVGS
jgi:vacuolar-type H+-ATPase subunit I/STV1